MASAIVVPTICISPPPPQEQEPEPCSPFASIPFPKTDPDSFRPTLLSPPPTRPTSAKHLSPLCPPDAPVTRRGIERERFEALLKASRERNALVGAKKDVDLRKEIALKAHKKQAERRALFLSKIRTPPSPAAVSTPKTPPDSPAIFHYSLPSPGLASPLSFFDSPNDVNDPYYSTPYVCHPWIERVDFRLCDETKKQEMQTKGAQVLPSLDQISARLRTLAQTRSSTVVDGLRPPATTTLSVPSRKPATIEVGRLKMPLRAAAGSSTPVNNNVKPQPQPQPCGESRQSNIIAFPSKCSASPFDLDTAITTHDSLLSRTSPMPLTESNLKILEVRESTAHNMLSTIRRRTLSVPQPPQPQTAPSGSAKKSFNVPGFMTRNAARRTTPLPVLEEVFELDLDARKSRWKRHSAPADLMPRERTGFEHPVLALPGAF